MAAKRKARRGAGAEAPAAPDPREHLPPSPRALSATIGGLAQVLGQLKPPAEPRPADLVQALIHFAVADGLPCRIGQDATERIAREYVDRNEFRVTEAFEVERLLADLAVPGLFDRCRLVHAAVGEIYNEQNDVSLEFLREAAVSDRNSFFQRVPSLPPRVVKYLSNLMSFEEVLLSDRSTLRAQVRLGLDPKAQATQDFIARARDLVAPFGGLPLRVSERRTRGRDEPVLCPACLLVRLAPPGRR